VFEGLDDVDWASMQHAYGSAADVPAMLRGLVSQDDGVRREAEEGMWGAVHHQGDVYDSTVAAIPFLLAIAGTSGTGQRAALDLLASVGGIDVSSLLEEGNPVPWVAPGASYVAARRQVAEARELLLAQLDSPQADVRCATVSAALVGPPTEAVAVRLREMHDREADPDARSVAQAALSWLSRQGVAGLDAWVRHQVTSENPKTRLSALTEAARRGEPPAKPLLGEAVHAVYDTHGPPVAPPAQKWFSRRQAVSRVRRAEAERWEISRLAEALADPTPLLLELLASQDWDVAADAIQPASEYIGKIRGQHSVLVTLIGEQLGAARREAATALEWIGPLAEPAREALADAPRQSSTVAALATLRDPRAVPALRTMLRQPMPPERVGFVIARMGKAAAPLHSDIRKALARRPGQARNGLLHAVAMLQIHDAADDVSRWLPDEAAIRSLRLLGPSASTAVPSLLRLLSREPMIAIAAAHALHVIDGNRAGVEVVLRELASPTNQHTFRSAADAAGDMGLTEAEQLLHAALLVEDPYGWRPFAAARALWRTTQDAPRVLPVIRDCWTKNDTMLLDLAQFLVEMGAASQPLHDLVQRELAETSRFTTRRGGSSSDQVTRDLQLVEACRAVVGSP
jgi:hypothetical protein